MHRYFYFCIKENAQRELMEKKRAEKERQKLEKEAKKKQQGDTSNASTSKPNKPEEEEDIIGALMKEIRRGKTLRRRSEGKSTSSSGPSKSGAELKKDDILKLQKIYEESHNEKPPDDKSDGHMNSSVGQATETKSTSDSHLLPVDYRKDRTKSEAFVGVQLSRDDPIRHSFHGMPHYETTV